MINHITYHLSPMGLHDIGGLMNALRFQEIATDDPFEHGYNVRWFARTGSPNVHFVADGNGGDKLVLGHFCVMVPEDHFRELRDPENPWLVRDSGSGRIWLQCDNVRIEVRSS